MKVKIIKNLPIYFAVLDETGKFTTKVNLEQAKEKRGAYLIFENNKLVYIGKSEYNLQKTISRHFQKWRDSAQPNRISYSDQIGKKKYKVRLILCKTADEADALELMLLEKYSDLILRDNKDFRKTKIETQQINKSPKSLARIEKLKNILDTAEIERSEMKSEPLDDNMYFDDAEQKWLKMPF